MAVRGLRHVSANTPTASNRSRMISRENFVRHASHGSRMLLGAAVLLVTVASCSGTQAAPSCTPGATQACLGPAQCPGVQTCEASGAAWGPCACGSEMDAAVRDASAPSSNGSSSDASDARAATTGLLIDDQSSNLGEISLPNGGDWFTFGTTGTITPPVGGPFVFSSVDAGLFSRAACFSGSGITGPGPVAGFAFQLAADDGGPADFDASAYSGISFYIMSPDTTEVLTFLIDIDTDEFWPGATCAGPDAGPVPPGGYPTPPCGDDPAAIVPVTPSWQQVNVMFASTGYPNPGYYDPPSVSAQGLIYMDFEVNNPDQFVDGGLPLSFHVCVAQIYFTP